MGFGDAVYIFLLLHSFHFRSYKTTISKSSSIENDTDHIFRKNKATDSHSLLYSKKNETLYIKTSISIPSILEYSLSVK